MTPSVASDESKPHRSRTGFGEKQAPWSARATRSALCGLQSVLPSLAGRVAARLMFRTSRKAADAWEGAVIDQSERLFLDGRRLAIYRWGRGPIVLLVHGWNGRGSQLGAFVEPLVRAGFQVVAFDAPGHGASRGSESSVVEFADAFDAVVDAVRPFFQPIHGVVAHSMGGAAVAFALGRARRSGRSGEGRLESGALEGGRLVFIAPPIDIRSFSKQFSSSLGLGERAREAIDSTVERRLGLRLDDLAALSIAKDMEAPLLVLHDEDDRAIPVTSGRRLAQAWPGAELRVTRGLGHSRILRDPESVNRVVAFLRCQAQSQAT
jgi:pimeloyl-ACP methyl ester carboxylesterase